ncbi:winged helix-turn-helix domain-containing protein [Acidomonas methanolica]|uniref:winged helix-turn-helix domain-containing protein n=1 Tax=Acidomonas methanolica TaxID=437 RepID=UPI00211A0AFD|nr:winged helix-turn-helix domain-containing protein [Acidomonas methanolica]MCQ9155004.1 winged helix-turn-helix domain-containing protein [Acidomonas methanolica]
MPKPADSTPGPTSDPRQADCRLSIRIYLPSGLRIGRGKIALLEAVADTGSISGAARKLAMSYKRAWDLLEEMNLSLKAPVITTAQGGSHGGGAVLTDLGHALITHYRAFERDAYMKGKSDLEAILDLARESGTP